MYLYSLLEVSEKTTELVKWISIGAVILLLLVIAFIGGKNKTYDAKKLAFAGICVSMSFTLAVLKFKLIESGGSITLASFVPVLIYAYVYGPAEGFTVGLIHGLLNFIESPYILTPTTFLLDYILAFTGIGVMGFFGKMKRKEKGIAPLVIGAVCVFALRFFFHFVSGMIFFTQDSVWVSLPNWAMKNAFIYSLIYQSVYVPIDAAIAIAVLIALAKTGVLDRLISIMRPKYKQNADQ